MLEDNKRNLLFFEAASMRDLYEILSHWQDENRKRLLSVSIHEDRGAFCCIALTNPTEVIICSGNLNDNSQAEVRGRLLHVSI